MVGEDKKSKFSKSTKCHRVKEFGAGEPIYKFIKFQRIPRYMGFEDMFKPYSPEIRGDLEEYLRECEEEYADNQFYGAEYFFEIKNRGLIIPGITCLRVGQSPAPDIGYFVNDDYLLESRGRGHNNMSLMGAKEGVYDPSKTLKDKAWSISDLKLWDEPKPSE